MSNLLHLLTKWGKHIKNSIAFYPALIAFSMIGFAIAAIYLEHTHITQKIANKLPVLIIHDPDTARSILNTMIGGIISLMVFSFSMVMVILNQASSNYSPRLLPGLITNKKHQIVLGVYMGTILFCILCSINVLPKEDSYSIPSLTILISIALGVLSLGMFIYFIHSISESIQISKIIKNLYDRGEQDVDNLLNQPRNILKSTSPLNQKIKSDKSGYLISISHNALIKLAKDNDLFIEVLKPLGLFVKIHEPIIALSRPINKTLKEKMLNCLQCSDNEVLKISHFTSIKSITEITLKAMSPGINDPGTAMIAINYLFLLLAKRMQLADIIYYADDNNLARVAVRLLLFEKLLFSSFAELRTYAAHDQTIVGNVLEGFDYLLAHPASSDCFYEFLVKEKRVFIEQGNQQFSTAYDKNIIFKN